MSAHSIKYCFEELESPRTQLQYLINLTIFSSGIRADRAAAGRDRHPGGAGGRHLRVRLPKGGASLLARPRALGIHHACRASPHSQGGCFLQLVTKSLIL